MFLTPADLATPELATDIAVVGAGAAGIAMAKALDAAGREVLLIEGGSFEIEDAAQALFDSAAIGEPMQPEDGRYRTFGGTTVAWTGRSATLDPIDFERRGWVPDSGWPIARAEVARFHDAAARLFGLGSWHDEEPVWFRRLRLLPGRPELVEPFLWRQFSIARGTFRHFGEMVRPAFAASRTLRVLMEADLVALEPAPGGGAIVAGWVRARSGARVRVAARQWVLCCGGIENARLLLNFAEQEPAAFSAVEHSLGRRFMQHPRATTATIRATPRQAVTLQRRFNLFRRRGLHHEAGFALPESAQRRHRLLNASAVLRYLPTNRGRLRDALVRPDRVASWLVARALERTPVFGRPEIALHVDVEQAPDPASRVLLVPERDAIGLRKAAVDWRIGALDRTTSARFTRAIGGWIEALGLGDAEFAADLDATGGYTADAMLESYHHLGATRMSLSADTGVVDGDLRLHGIDNLFVCGASVMPTGGHANPTLTIVALALRLAEHLGRL